uniref:Integrase zinc-binding domain-containing protein n=1 Tax=Graphocephala atropunctata TaxID=36148 RepID=A0A1B6MUI0_9HEMI
MFEFYHTSVNGGHFGILKTQRKINFVFYHPKINEFVRKKVSQCDTCLRSKSSNWNDKQKLLSNINTRAMEKLYVDIFGPLPKSSAQNECVLMAVDDDFTKYCWVLPLNKSH